MENLKSPLPSLPLVLLAVLSDAPAQESEFLAFAKSRAAAMRADDRAPASLAEWEAQRVEIRRRLLAAWGGFPDARSRSPLRPRLLGTLRRDGYRVEKLIFQTMPGVWMTANAYVPEGDGKFPAVLCVHGHSPGAKQEPKVQHRCIGLAKLGFFVLAVDAFGAGERGLGKALGEYHGEMVAATLWPLGRPLSGLQVYENMRAVDYLRTRREVDAERLGITGASGGGNQTMYAGAFDERWKAVVPVCSVGNYQAYLGAACCMCEVVPGALSFTEESGVLSLTAPRALMVINATRDAFQFSVGEAEKSLAATLPVYALYGQSSHLRHSVFEAPHAYNQPMREAMYGWMTWHLKGEGDGSSIDEPQMQTEEPETLRCFPGDSRPDDWMTIPKFAAREARRLLATRSPPADKGSWTAAAAPMRRRLERVLGGTRPLDRRPRANRVEDRVDFAVEPGIRLSLRDLPTSSDRERLTLVLDLGDESPAARERLTWAGENRDASVLSLRATGRRAYPRDRIGRAPDHNTAEWSLWLGRPLLGQWVMDIRAALDALESLGELPGEIRLQGFGPAGVVAITAAAIDERVDQVIAEASLASFVSDVPYENQRLGILVPRILPEVGDIQQLAALVAPRRVMLIAPVAGDGKPMKIEAARIQFQQAHQVFGLFGASDRLKITSR